MLQKQSWGVQLWDQTANLIKYQETGIGLHERLQKFILDIAKLQGDSFSAQKKLCEKALINIKKVIGIETSYGQGYNNFVHAIAKLIDTENLMAMSLSLQANGETKQALEEERKGLKQWKQSRDRFQGEVKSQSKIIEDELKRYNEKYRDVAKSKEDYEHVDEDVKYSKLDVERALNVYSLKHSEFKRAQSDYLAAMEQFNLYRHHHYSYTLKHWGETGQELEGFRIGKTRDMINVLVERFRVMIDRLTSVCNDLETAASTIDAEKDTAALIERLCTGKSIPGDIPPTKLDVSDPPALGIESGGGGGYTTVQLQSASGQQSENTPAPDAPSLSSHVFAATEAVESAAPHSSIMTSTTYHNRSGSARRFHSNSLGNTGNPGTSGGGGGGGGGRSSSLWKLFSRRSKRMTSTDDSGGANSLLFEAARPWRRSRRSKSVSNYLRPSLCVLPTGSGPKACANDVLGTAIRNATSVQSLSKESERRMSVQLNTSLVSRSQSTREGTTRVAKIIPANHEQTAAGGDYSSDISDAETEGLLRCNQPAQSSAARLPTSSSQSAPGGSLETTTPASLAQQTIVRSNSSPSTAMDVGNYSRYPPPSRSPAVTPMSHRFQNPKLPDLVGQLTRPHCESKGTIVGAVTSLARQPNRLVQARSGMDDAAGSRQAQHQPKRHPDSANRRNSRRNASPVSHSPTRGATTQSDLIVVGMCTALYDFESETFGENFLSFKAGDELKMISSSSRWQGLPDNDGWIYAQSIPSDEDHLRSPPHRGFIPTSFVDLRLYPDPVPLSSPRRIHRGEDAATSRHRMRGAELLALGQATDI